MQQVISLDRARNERLLLKFLYDSTDREPNRGFWMMELARAVALSRAEVTAIVEELSDRNMLFVTKDHAGAPLRVFISEHGYRVVAAWERRAPSPEATKKERPARGRTALVRAEG